MLFYKYFEIIPVDFCFFHFFQLNQSVLERFTIKIRKHHMVWETLLYRNECQNFVPETTMKHMKKSNTIAPEVTLSIFSTYLFIAYKVLPCVNEFEFE